MEQKILEILELLYLSRFVDVKMSHLVKQNKGGTFFLSTAGHELVGIVCANELIKGKDFSLPYYRDRAFVLSLGAKLEDLVAAFLAREISSFSRKNDARTFFR